MANCSCPEPFRLLVTCEHAGNLVPAEYRHLFAGQEAVLQTHRGYDRYALEMAETLAGLCAAPLFAAPVTRLLVDCNRTPASRNLFSSFARGLAPEEKKRVCTAYHTPHQAAVQAAAARMRRAGAVVVHVAVHTFTPELHGRVRTADLGLLYDPARQGERLLCRDWLAELRRCFPALRLRRNYPYLGKTNCLAKLLRDRHGDRAYLGIEVEINQGTAARADRAGLARGLAASLVRTLQGLSP